jgi:GNAT superfamily N-acetyltransferase
VKQIEAIFDVPARQKLRRRWSGEVPIEEEDWNVGLIVGPSGSGKSTVARTLFGAERSLLWSNRAVIDDFDSDLCVEEVALVCQSVGFGTITSWMKPFHALSTGERFRAELARRLLSNHEAILCDEFTSVVDRHVARIGAHAVQKFVRRTDRKFVAATCHNDVEDWLQPDWTLEMPSVTFSRRCLQRHPSLQCEIRRVPYSAWQLFAPFHYLTANLHRAARCFGLFVDGELASFAAFLQRPHPKVRHLVGCSRLVTLPDWQGLGLGPRLLDCLSAAHRTLGRRVRMYSAHPILTRQLDRSPNWRLVERPGAVRAIQGRLRGWNVTRPCAVFEWCGTAWDDRHYAKQLLGFDVHRTRVC